MVRKKERFRYQPRDRENLKRRANQQGGLYDTAFKSEFPVFSPKEQKYRLRILPPTWSKPKHFGYDVFVHYSVGSDNQSYLCLEKGQGKPCFLCEERKRVERSDPEAARELATTRRVLVWVIDRGDEDAGPQLWSMPWTVDRDLATLSIEAESGTYLNIDDDEKGYDISFTRTGKGLKTKYVGTKIARRASALSDDPDVAERWLAYVNEHPLPDVLQFFDYDRIAAAAQGVKAAEDEDEDLPPKRRPSKAAEADDDEDEDLPPKRRPSKAAEADDDDDDEDEDLPPKRRPSKAAEADDDEDEDDEDKDDEDEDLPPKRPTKTKSKRAGSAAARASADDDDDDE